MRLLNEVGIDIMTDALKALHREIERVKAGKICEKTCKCDKCKSYRESIRNLRKLKETE